MPCKYGKKSKPKKGGKSKSEQIGRSYGFPEAKAPDDDQI